MKENILISTGGSGGHVVPAQTLYEHLKNEFNVFLTSDLRGSKFFENSNQKELIEKSFQEIEKKFNKKIVTLVWKFDIFYPAENYHQDYYEKNFISYLMYKNACKREETLKKIWN